MKCEGIDIFPDKPSTITAVKFLKNNHSAELESSFRKEVEILSFFDHPNVIKLLGVCINEQGPMCIVLGKLNLTFAAICFVNFLLQWHSF